MLTKQLSAPPDEPSARYSHTVDIVSTAVTDTSLSLPDNDSLSLLSSPSSIVPSTSSSILPSTSISSNTFSSNTPDGLPLDSEETKSVTELFDTFYCSAENFES